MGLSSQELSSLSAGITRLREKGGASPSSLYDLVNAYIDQSGSPTGRDGTVVEAVLPTGTTGMCAFQGKLHVFALAFVDVGTDYVCDILIHPDQSFTGTIKRIHFAKPFLGYLYVVAEFSDGSVYHYWLQSSGAWQANMFYKAGDTVVPTTPNGLRYQPVPKDLPVAWAPSVPRAIGDVVQPTVYTGWKYTVTAVDGDNPASSLTEPAWIKSNGAIIYEDQDTTPKPTTPTPDNSTPGGSRYDNLPSYKNFGSAP